MTLDWACSVDLIKEKENSGDMENCESFRGFDFIYIYIYI